MSDEEPLTSRQWLQVLIGALAAMTAAWVASYLGVAGTVIGAAVGSITASIASATYLRGVDRGSSLISVRGQDTESVAGAEKTTGPKTKEVDWRSVGIWSAVTLAVSLLAIGGYELVTGSAFGNQQNPSIGRPWTDGATEPAEPSTTPTTAATTTPTAATTTAPTTAPTVEPTPQTSPTLETEPTPDAAAPAE
ncbi:MAG TPA: hypothetical protein PLQ19_03210 [Aeromicrobium sp.]|nr:hypothetical protein [Aeromicrobium sp.]